MKTLDKNEWVAVVIAIFVVGFFFVFGESLISIFTNNPSNSNTSQTPKVSIQDEVIGQGDVAETGNSVVIHYIGKFTDGTVFDSSVARGEPVQFVLGVGKFTKGWDEGIVGMRVGGKRILVVPPELGYGANDYGPIPANSTLVFEIQLLKVDK